MFNVVWKYVCALFFGVIAVVEPTLRFAIVLFFAVLLDCISAFDLSRRVKRNNPEKASGKFKSRYALRMIKTFLQAYSVIVLLHFTDVILLDGFGYLNLSNMGAAVFCAIQIWSILENISSENGATWAKQMQKIMTDKAKRHFDIDLKTDEYEK